MDKHIEKLSKPVGFVGLKSMILLAEGGIGYIKPNDAFGGTPVYSQEYIDSLLAKLEAAQGSIKELESKINHYVAAEYAHKNFDQTAEIIKRADSAELELVKVKAALSAANEKLLKPVKLPKTNGYWDAEEQAFERGIQLAHQEIRIAGFRVEGDE